MSDDQSGLITWRQLAREVAEQLNLVGIDGAERNGRWIALKASGADPDEWPTVADQPATVRGVAAIDAMARRRAMGEPLQYVLGEWSFRYLDLFVDRRVLIPRPETEVVAEAALAEMHRLAPQGATILVADLGTGSGAIGLALAAEHPGAEVWLTDASSQAIEVARANIAGVGRPGTRVRLAQGSWFEALPAELAGRFGVIVSNPPYVADSEALPVEVAAWEPAAALYAGPEGTEHLHHLVDEAGPWLTPDGALVLEMAPAPAPVVANRAQARFAEVTVAPDLTGRDRAVVARRPRR
jgi:release factor glutamine methyltransferase